jgi:hypothetical protein
VILIKLLSCVIEESSVKIEILDGTVCDAEVHWYEAHGIGKKEIKVKHTIGE